MSEIPPSRIRHETNLTLDALSTTRMQHCRKDYNVHGLFRGRRSGRLSAWIAQSARRQGSHHQRPRYLTYCAVNIRLACPVHGLYATNARKAKQTCSTPAASDSTNMVNQRPSRLSHMDNLVMISSSRRQTLEPRNVNPG